MIAGVATCFRSNGDEYYKACEIVRILKKDRKVLVYFPGDSERTHVKTIERVRIRRPNGDLEWIKT